MGRNAKLGLLLTLTACGSRTELSLSIENDASCPTCITDAGPQDAMVDARRDAAIDASLPDAPVDARLRDAPIDTIADSTSDSSADTGPVTTCASIKASDPSAQDGTYLIAPTGGAPMRAYCDMRLGVDLCDEVQGLHEGLTREGSSLHYTLMSVLVPSARYCKIWDVLSGTYPLDTLETGSGLSPLTTCQALGFLADVSGGMPCATFGSDYATSCGYDVSSGHYRYGNHCSGCTLDDGFYGQYVLQGEMYTASVMSSADGTNYWLCRTE